MFDLESTEFRSGVLKIRFNQSESWNNCRRWKADMIRPIGIYEMCVSSESWSTHLLLSPDFSPWNVKNDTGMGCIRYFRYCRLQPFISANMRVKNRIHYLCLIRPWHVWSCLSLTLRRQWRSKLHRCFGSEQHGVHADEGNWTNGIIGAWLGR